jgi:hemoglobin-like flavoprotein
MTPEQITLVEESLAAAASRLDDIAADFYVRLFGADPGAAAMFIRDPRAQRAKFVAGLSAIMTSIERHEEFLREACELGACHRGTTASPAPPCWAHWAPPWARSGRTSFATPGAWHTTSRPRP